MSLIRHRRSQDAQVVELGIRQLADRLFLLDKSNHEQRLGQRQRELGSGGIIDLRFRELHDERPDGPFGDLGMNVPKKGGSDVPTHPVSQAARRAYSPNAAVGSDALPAVVHLRHACGNRRTLTTGSSQLLEFQIEPGCLMANSQAYSRDRLYSP